MIDIVKAEGAIVMRLPAHEHKIHYGGIHVKAKNQNVDLLCASFSSFSLLLEVNFPRKGKKSLQRDSMSEDDGGISLALVTVSLSANQEKAKESNEGSYRHNAGAAFLLAYAVEWQVG